ncbi:MAG: hypothetical protein OEO23_04125 [Gemmatimonadota bacterium]|nr:hypothetical protein [Gemmatimonadota bacterium]
MTLALPLVSVGSVAAQQSDTAAAEVDLSGDLLPAIDVEQENAFGRAWYQNFELSGFGAFGFIDSGETGTAPEGGFQIQEATIFVETDIWRNSSIFVEIQTNRLGADESKFIRTAEVYGHFRDLIETPSLNLGLKAGRIDIPFGEEYLAQDAPDNPLISFSAAYPYGWDEGVLLYGEAWGVGWIAAVTDGADDRSIEDNSEKAYNLKLYGDAFSWLYLSGSLMKNGDASKSAVEFGGSHFQPIGASHPSTVGASPSPAVDALLYEVDAKIRLGDNRLGGYLSGAFGQAAQDDADDAFDRDLRWHTIEGLISGQGGLYLAARYSEVGTYDPVRGWHFDGKPTAGGNGAFGYDVERFRRVSLGVGWDPNPQVRLKVEVGEDDFKLIESAIPGSDGSRTLFGVGLTMRF